MIKKCATWFHFQELEMQKLLSECSILINMAKRKLSDIFFFQFTFWIADTEQIIRSCRRGLKICINSYKGIHTETIKNTCMKLKFCG